MSPTSSAPAATPVTFRLNPSAGSLRWTVTLENTSTAPVEVVTDRRLVWLEITPAPPAEPVAPDADRRPRRPRPLRATRCAAPARPASNEGASRAVLAPGVRYTEGIDLRELCGVRLPRALAAGATVTAHYGFRVRRPSFAHAVVLDGRSPPVGDLLATSTITLGSGGPFPPAVEPSSNGDTRVSVRVSGSLDAARLDGIRPVVRVTRASPYPLRTFYRAGQVRFEVTDPEGRNITCQIGSSQYAPVRDFFVALPRRGGVGGTIALADLCPREAFARPGVYRARAVYESRTGGEAFGFQSFVGAANSPYFYFRLTRGDQPGAYRPLPVADPFTSVTPRGDAARGRS